MLPLSRSRCPVTWCTVWKGMVQDCVAHMRLAHDIPPVVKAANLARWFPPWTVTREQWTSMTRPAISGVAVDTLFFSRIGVPLFHRYRVVNRLGTHGAFRGSYMRRLHASGVGCDVVTEASQAGAGGRFFQDHGIGSPSSLRGEHCTSSDGFGASSI